MKAVRCEFATICVKGLKKTTWWRWTGLKSDTSDEESASTGREITTETVKEINQPTTFIKKCLEGLNHHYSEPGREHIWVCSCNQALSFCYDYEEEVCIRCTHSILHVMHLAKTLYQTIFILLLIKCLLVVESPRSSLTNRYLKHNERELTKVKNHHTGEAANTFSFHFCLKQTKQLIIHQNNSRFILKYSN